jgi:heptosyltransferase-2
MVMAQSLFKQLRSDQPALKIDVLAPSWCLPLLERMPEVRRGIDVGMGHGEFGLLARRKLGKQLQSEAYSRAIILPRSLKAALVPFFARIPERVGFRGEYRYGLLTDIRPFDPTYLNQTVKRFIALGLPRGSAIGPIPQPSMRVDPGRQARLFDKFGMDRSLDTVALAPGAEYGPAKRWPAVRFGELAQRLAESQINVAILGSAKELAIGEEISTVANHPLVKNLCGRTELVDTVDILGNAVVAVSNDSGLLHVAAAVGTHVVAIYGSSTPDFTPPLTAKADIVYERVDCSPCFKRVCPLQHFKCMEAISTGFVEHTVRQTLTNG